jgi:hypothetical protein
MSSVFLLQLKNAASKLRPLQHVQQTQCDNSSDVISTATAAALAVVCY